MPGGRPKGSKNSDVALRKLKAIPDPLEGFEARKRHEQGQRDEDARQEWAAHHFRQAATHFGIATEHEVKGDYRSAETHHSIAQENEAKARRILGEAVA